MEYTVYTTDTAALGSVLSGTNEILDITPSVFSDVQTALSTSNLNVTSQAGASFEDLKFNMYCTASNQLNCPPGVQFAFRQAMAHIINYSYIQHTVLSDVQGIATPQIYLNTAFVGTTPTTYTIYKNDLSAANASLSADPQIAWSSTDKQPASSNTIACSGKTGVWEYATAMGSHKGNGTAFEPQLITRPDHPTWFTFAQQYWSDAAKIGLCINLRQVVHYSSVYPIVYAAYNSNWNMYDGGQSFSGLLDATGNAYFDFTSAGFAGGPQFNTEYFNNATITSLLSKAYFTTNGTLSAQLTQQAVTLLQQQIPTVALWWDNVLIPSVNHDPNGAWWSGYVNVPGFSTWQTGSLFYTSLSVHQINPATGATIVGGQFNVAQHENPDGFNVFNDNSVYDADVYNNIYESPVTYPPSSPTLTAQIPWMLTSLPSAQTFVNGTTPHGYKMVNGMQLTLNFMKNITSQDNVPITAADFNFSLWYPNLNGAVGDGGKINATYPFPGGCSAVCWAKYVDNTAQRYTGSVPDLIDSAVSTTNPYQMTIYMNKTGIEDYYAPLDSVLVPQHLWANVNSTALNNDIQPELAASAVKGDSLAASTGPFEFGQFVNNQYTTTFRFPGYYRTDIQDWALSGTVGSPVPLSLNLTSIGVNSPPVPIPSSAQVKVQVWKGSSMVGSTSLTASGSSWTGSLPTSGMSAGFYEIVANGTYTGSDGLFHTAIQFWGLNLGTQSAGTTSSTGNTGGSTGTVTQTASVTQTQGTTVTAISTVTQSASSSSSNNNNYILAAIVVVVVIIIAGVAAYIRRR